RSLSKTIPCAGTKNDSGTIRASRQRASTSAPSIKQHESRYSSASTLCGIPRPAAVAPVRCGGLLFSSAMRRVGRAPLAGRPRRSLAERPGGLPPCLALPALLVLGGLFLGRGHYRVLGHDVKGQLDRDVGVELHLDRVLAERLDRRVQLDPLAVDRDAGADELVVEVARSDGAEHLAALARHHREGQARLLQLLRELLGAAQLVGLALRAALL